VLRGIRCGIPLGSTLGESLIGSFNFSEAEDLGAVG
jgi:hypothetical protein